MIIRSSTELDDVLNESLAWRKKEIITLALEAKAAREHQQKLLCRAAILVLYAHWEGFVKESAEAYLAFVARQGRAFRQLQPGIVAVLLRNRIRQDGQSSSVVQIAQLVDFFFHNLSNKPEWPRSGLVITESNLAARVLDEIFRAVGLTMPTELAAKGLLLEQRLVLTRHKIAHGNRVFVDVADVLELKEHLMGALETVRTELLNAAITNAFELGRKPAS